MTTYKLYRDGTLINSNATSPYVDTGLTNGQQYSYQVSAVNAVGEGPKSNTVTIIPSATNNPPLASAGELQTLINNATTGTTVNVPWKRYVETITINKALTLNGQSSIIDGQNTRTTWASITADNVNINEFIMQDAAAGSFQQGGITCSNHNNVTLARLHLIKGPNSAINFQNGSGHRFIDLEVERCPMSGFGSGSLTNFKILSTNNPAWPARWHHNRTSLSENPLNEGGAFKISNGNDIEVSGQEVDHNAGPGIWFDINNLNVLCHDNNAHHNTHASIFFEISQGTSSIYNNYVWENGYNIVIDSTTYNYDSRGDAFGWPAAILLSSSKNIEVYNNLHAWNRVGLGVIYQGNRSDRQVPATGTYLHNNTIIGSSGRYLVTWNQDGTGGTLYSDSTNRGANGQYWSGGGDVTNFQYNGGKTLSTFNSSNGEENGVYISSSTRNAMLTAANIPLSPESGH